MNNIFTACDANTGQVLFSGTAFNPKSLEINNVIVYLDQEYTEGWIANGMHFDLPAKPNEFCVFDYVTKQWVDTRTVQTEWDSVRNKRDLLLLDCDWTQLPDVVLSNKDQWVTYRQELRDITTQPDPFNIIWPTPPQG